MFFEGSDTHVEDPKTPVATSCSAQDTSSFVFSPSHRRSFLAKSPIVDYRDEFIFRKLPEACIAYIFEFLTLSDRFTSSVKHGFHRFCVCVFLGQVDNALSLPTVLRLDGHKLPNYPHGLRHGRQPHVPGARDAQGLASPPASETRPAAFLQQVLVPLPEGFHGHSVKQVALQAHLSYHS